MKKKICILGIVIILIFVILISIYRFKNFGHDANKSHYFKYNSIYEQYSSNSEVYDFEVNKNYIINENLTSVDYAYYYEGNNISGQIYIGKDRYLYITDNYKNDFCRVSAVKFKTMYVKDYEFNDGVFVYLISEDNELYLMTLQSNDIRDVMISRHNGKTKFTNFASARIKYDKYEDFSAVFALATDDYIYDVNCGLLYDSDRIALYNSLYVQSDRTMTNIAGHIVKSNDNVKYKIKYIFDTYENNKFIDNNKIIVITEDNKFIYFDDNMENVYEFSKDVTDVTFDIYYPYLEGNLKITFDDGYNVSLKASCNQYFCVNEFAE